MSLIPAESLAVALCPGSVGLVWHQGRAHQKSECIEAASEEGPAWRGAVESLAKWLVGHALERRRISVVLSSRFVRYALVPWPSSALKRGEGAVWPRVHLEAAYGDMSGWAIVCDPGAYGSAHVACAVQVDLLHALRETFASRRLALSSIEPAFVCAWNRWRICVAPGEFFGVAESDRFVLGCLGQRGWESLRLLSTRVTSDELTALTHRERALLGKMDGPRAVLHAPGVVQHRSGQSDGNGVRWVSVLDDQGAPALEMARLAAAA